MERRLANLAFLALFLLSINVVGFGQVVGFFSINQAYDSNPFRYPDSQSSWVSDLGLGIQYDWDNFSVSYSGNFSRFETVMERNFYYHQLAAFGRFSGTQYGFTFEQNLNRGDYEIYNSNSWTAYINQYFNLWDINFYGNLDAELSNYTELEDLDNYKLEVELKSHKSFETGTTIIFGSALYYKKYLNTNVFVSGDTITQSGGHGYGRHGGGGSYVNYTYHENDAPSVSQIQLWLRLAQSVTQSTGLALNAQTRFHLSGTSRYFSGISYNYTDESQIFDDPLGYESVSIGGELTQLLPYSIVAKSAYYYTEKNYSVQGTFLDFENYDSTTLRKDDQNYAWISLQRSFKYSLMGNAIITLKLNYRILNNNSNSFFYNYENQVFNFGLSVDF